MVSSFGRIEDIPIPRFRNSRREVEFKTLGIFQEEQDKFTKLVEQMHLMGISQRGELFLGGMLAVSVYDYDSLELLRRKLHNLIRA